MDLVGGTIAALVGARPTPASKIISETTILAISTRIFIDVAPIAFQTTFPSAGRR
jgi:hypothetical protein